MKSAFALWRKTTANLQRRMKTFYHKKSQGKGRNGSVGTGKTNEDKEKIERREGNQELIRIEVRRSPRSGSEVHLLQ